MYLFKIFRQLIKEAKGFERQMEELKKLTGKFEPQEDFYKRLSEIGKAASSSGLSLADVLKRTNDWQRAIKKLGFSQEEIKNMTMKKSFKEELKEIDKEIDHIKNCDVLLPNIKLRLMQERRTALIERKMATLGIKHDKKIRKLNSLIGETKLKGFEILNNSNHSISGAIHWDDDFKTWRMCTFNPKPNIQDNQKNINWQSNWQRGADVNTKIHKDAVVFHIEESYITRLNNHEIKPQEFRVTINKKESFNMFIYINDDQVKWTKQEDLIKGGINYVPLYKYLITSSDKGSVKAELIQDMRGLKYS